MLTSDSAVVSTIVADASASPVRKREATKFCTKMATPAGFEPATPRLGIWCSIQLSYGASACVV
jgi:hypothetical protein